MDRLHGLREGRPARGARGGRTPTRGSPATSPPISTPTRSPSTPSGATSTPRAPRSRPTSRTWPSASASSSPSGSATRSCAANSPTGGGSLTTAAGHRDEVDVVIAATGVLHHPKYPEIKGLESFAGAMFHSARWDHGVALDGARVGIVGTGSTAVQIVSAVVDRVAQARAVPTHRPVGHAPAQSGIHDDELAAFRENPQRLTDLHAELVGPLRPLLRCRGRRRVAAAWP